LKIRLSRLRRRDIRDQRLVEYLLALTLIVFAARAAQQIFAFGVVAFESMATQLEYILGTGKKVPLGQAKNRSNKCE
jgi:hypothetical protein